MNVSPLTHYSELSPGMQVMRDFNDVTQNAGRVVVMAGARFAAAISGKRSKWVSIQSNRDKRRDLRLAKGPGEWTPAPLEGVARYGQGGARSTMAQVSLRHVAQVLPQMGRSPKLIEKLRPMPPPEADYFEYALDRNTKETAFKEKVRLLPQGKELLAQYYALKYGTSISFPPHVDLKAFVKDVAGLIAELRKTPGDFRHLYGPGTYHAVPIFIVREGAKEALLVADSNGWSHWENADDIAQACKAKGLNIPVYAVLNRRQMDVVSCFTDAIKTGVILTRRQPLEDGRFGDFVLPDLIAQFERSTPLAGSDPEAKNLGVGAEPAYATLVRVPAEMLRLAQTRQFIERQAGQDYDLPLRGDKHGRTAREFEADYTVTFTRDGLSAQRLDYLRQKDLRYAEIIQIQYYNRQLLERLGDADWGLREQLEFTRLMKREVRGATASADQDDRPAAAAAS